MFVCLFGVFFLFLFFVFSWTAQEMELHAHSAEDVYSDKYTDCFNYTILDTYEGYDSPHLIQQSLLDLELT